MSLELHPASRGLDVAPCPSHTHSKDSLSSSHNGCCERGAFYVGLPGTDRSLPGMAENWKQWKSLHCTNTNACTAVHPALNDTGTNSVQTHVLLYDTYCYTSYTSTSVFLLSERGAWRGMEGQKPPYRPRSSMVRPTTSFFCLFLFFSALPSPVSGIVPRLFCCTLVVLL